MRNNRKTPLKGHTTLAIIGDGECEFWYFQMLKRNERTLKITIKPEIPQKKKLKDQYQKVIEASKDYNKVFWLIDFDVIIKETHSAPKGKKTPVQEFREYYTKLTNDFKNVIVIINNPCLEFWLLLHFECTNKYFDNCEETTKKLLKYLPNYAKTEKYYTKQNDDLYLKLKPRICTAIENAQKLSPFSFEEYETSLSQMHLFFNMPEINDILKKQ